MPETQSNDTTTNPPMPDGNAEAAPAALPTTEDAAAELASQLEAAKAEAAANYDKFVRTAADMENLRRRTMGLKPIGA